MTPSKFASNVRQLAHQTGVIELSGRLDGHAETLLWDATALATGGGARRLILDGTGLQGMDGNGLTALVAVTAWAAKHQQRIATCGLADRCRRVLQEVGLDSTLPNYGSLGEATGGAFAPDASANTTEDPCPVSEWAVDLGRARLPEVPEGYSGLNVADREVVGPMEGFGQLWHKVYRVRLPVPDLTPADLVALCRERLGEFWPKGNRLYVPPPGIEPGAVGLIDLTLPGGAPLGTGVRVLHSGETSFTFMTLAGHLEAGWITFAAFSEDRGTVFQVASLARTGDPMYEAGFLALGHGEQEKFWVATAENLARHFGLQARVQVSRSCVDPERHWHRSANLLRNAAAATALTRVRSLLSRGLRRRRS